MLKELESSYICIIHIQINIIYVNGRVKGKRGNVKNPVENRINPMSVVPDPDDSFFVAQSPPSERLCEY